jgi:hypothetical protein
MVPVPTFKKWILNVQVSLIKLADENVEKVRHVPQGQTAYI